MLLTASALYRYFASRDDLLTELVIDAYQDLAGALTAAVSPLPQPLAGQLIAWAEPYAPGAGPATALSAVLIWSRLHGMVSLEIAGNFASMGIDPGQLFEVELTRLTS